MIAAALAGLIILCALLLATSSALGAARLTSAVPSSAVSAPPAQPVGAPVAGRLKLVLQHVGGSPPFALLGERITVQGRVVPYVAGQTVKVSIYRRRRRVEVRILSVLASGNGEGRFHINYASTDGGLVEVRAAHYATALQVAFSARAQAVRFVNASVGPGAKGQSVRLLQAELDALHYAVPLTGVFEEGTALALIAYRKVTGQQLVPSAGRRLFGLLERGAGSFHVRYPRDGRHVEADLTRQVLAEIEPGGHVRAVYAISSGKPSTPTVVGHFQVYSKTPGVNSEGMVDSNYFIGGYAIHGYPEVPTYAASHGCLRLPIRDAAGVYEWVRLGTSVDVYEESGGGSRQRRGDAGP
jgi:peptidoglycan hydrolase-like protein with peptidoglycan-binding domain